MSAEEAPGGQLWLGFRDEETKKGKRGLFGGGGGINYM